ncbi:CHAD domain-containing protein [Streptomyces sp. TR02-1]|uniref:CYTH and CHAD domain-containing protein n=1 Tax=Streptomyces sp. TR02-1 TaxID=3385977 RepID=UPI0039A22CE3
MADMVREVERKYEATDDTELPDLHVKGVATVTDRGHATLRAVYWDTADSRLAADGVTLRRRTGGTHEGWHLKLPAGPHTRDEYRVPLAASPPRTLTALVRSRARTEPLEPIVELTSERHTFHLQDAEGTLLAEVSRDTVTATRLGTDDTPTAHWTEIEAELADGPPELLERVGKRLRKAGLRPSRAASKLQRALDETGGTPPSSEPGPPPTPRNAGDHVLAYVRTQVRALVALDPAVRRNQPDSVHRMRVATRRLRSCFRSHRAVLDRSTTDALGEELRWLAAELGQDRDREVLMDRLLDHLAHLPRPLRLGPVRTRLHTYDRARRTRSRRSVTAVLDGRRYLALLDALADLLADPPLRPAAAKPAERVLARAVRRDTARLDARVREALAAPAGDARDQALHRARKAAKRARYAAEVARPALGKPAAKHVERTTALQRLLGDHHDGVVARAALRDLAQQAHDAGEHSFTYGVLYEQERTLAQGYERDLPAARRAATEHRF